ncbi:MAG: type II secretion system protein GspM [Alphaproteobacteria bacterium]
MRDFLSNLVARLTGLDRQQRLYALLAAVAVAVVARYSIAWLVDYRRSVKEDIQLSADRLANARRTVERAPELSGNLQGLQQRYRETVKQLVPGDTPTLAAATLQERVSAIAGQRSVSLQTTQVMKDEAVGPFRKVSLRITAAAELRHLAEFLTDLEFGQLRVSIPFIEVNRRGGVRTGTAGRSVSATLEVSGIVQGTADESNFTGARAAKAAPAPSPGAGGAAAAPGGSGGAPPGDAGVPKDALGTGALQGNEP